MTEPTGGTSTPRVTARAARRRAEIVEAARQVFTSRGFRGGSLGEIAERVGITHQGVLHHFGSKERLLVEVLRDRDIEDGPGSETLTGAAFLSHLIDTARLNTTRSGIVQAYTVLSAESVTPGHPAQGWFRTRFADLRSEVYQALRIVGGIEVGEAELERGASAVIAVMDGLQVQWLLDPAAVDMPATLRMVINSLLAGWGRPALPQEPNITA
ncbi:DNA-binding transcriptional regulator, AcrR family [Nakamurella panacisegetis]|uniref:DNA-binding transcriptional regulator, AcrR family n=1 Tax=Nakamurella panacisegetis TaxID=1090615 RepID=A0A1H0RRT0_9ACTN|nr:TetR/AcrR family transcriptional regulator [Nakamurella panacisegetis]SDP32105.1 DNA-binding transcriptional regulator, AcrR family [Nakamurella panacisegetis]